MREGVKDAGDLRRERKKKNGGVKVRMRNRGSGEWGVANLGDEMKETRRVSKDSRNRKVRRKTGCEDD